MPACTEKQDGCVGSLSAIYKSLNRESMADPLCVLYTLKAYMAVV